MIIEKHVELKKIKPAIELLSHKCVFFVELQCDASKYNETRQSANKDVGFRLRYIISKIVFPKTKRCGQISTNSKTMLSMYVVENV